MLFRDLSKALTENNNLKHGGTATPQPSSLPHPYSAGNGHGFSPGPAALAQSNTTLGPPAGSTVGTPVTAVAPSTGGPMDDALSLDPNPFPDIDTDDL